MLITCKPIVNGHKAVILRKKDNRHDETDKSKDLVEKVVN